MIHTVDDYRLFLKKRLQEDRYYMLESWAAGNFTRENGEGTLQLNSKYLGYIEAVDMVIDYLDKEVILE